MRAAIERSQVTVNDVIERDPGAEVLSSAAVVLDVREDKEYAGGHIPKARHIPLGQLAGRMQELEKFKGKPILVTCRSGHRSARACGMLKKAGFETVYNQAGGILAWERANLPVTQK